MERKTYRTEGREKLLRFFEDRPDCQFTAEELCQQINGAGGSGRSSVYRRLTELCESGAVKMFRSEDLRRNVYQYVGAGCDCREHFHAKCLRCGKLEHLACGDSSLFARHLQCDHGFTIDCGQSVLFGICAECGKKSEGTTV